jgi:hypothetical protein
MNIAERTFLRLLKDQLIKYAIAQLLGESASGVKVFIVKTIAEYLFDRIVSPVIVWTWRESMIMIDVIAVKKAVEKYKDALAKIDRIDAFNDLP